jgi:antitoxin component YwqK of YwqJK toxin-antitoxin module
MADNLNVYPRVNEDLLDYDDDLRTYEDEPFTGVGYARFPDGKLRSETSYRNGLPHGLVKKWDSSGRILSECECRRGMKYGRYREWHPNGCLKIDATYEWGIELSYSEWDEAGELLQTRVLDPNAPDSNYKILLKFRKIYE